MDVYKNIENVCIRSMRQEDLDEVIAMESLFFGAHPDLTAYKKACLRTGNIYMVAEINGCIIAYCTIITSYETADLCNIAVKKEYRRCHIASRLLEESFLRFISLKSVVVLLEAWEDNLPALDFYKIMGFKEIGRRKAYYSNPYADAIVMEKKLVLNANRD